MRLPDIPQRHRLLVRTVSTVGSCALSIVRRRDFDPAHEPVVRAAYSVATAALTWLGGTRAFADQDVDGFGDLFAPGGTGTGESAPYVEEDPGDGGPRDSAFGYLESAAQDDAWTVEDATWKSQAFFNAAAAVSAGVASWVLWTPIQNVKDTWDAKLPDGVGRGLNAALNSSVMALTAFALDKAGEFVAREAFDGHIGYAPVEIDLPPHIRGSLNALLDQPHPQSQDVAEVVRAQLEHARFFVSVPYSTTQFPGSDPIDLSDEDFAALLAEEDVSSIDVYHDSEAPTAVPATQRYPVVGVVEAVPSTGGDADAGDGESSTRELSLEISHGLLSRIDLLQLEHGDDLIVAAGTADRLGASAPGTLHPDGVDGYPDTEDLEEVDGTWIPVGTTHGDSPGYTSSFEVLLTDDAPTVTLADWPAPGDLTFRTDRG